MYVLVVQKETKKPASSPMKTWIRPNSDTVPGSRADGPVTSGQASGGAKAISKSESSVVTMTQQVPVRKRGDEGIYSRTAERASFYAVVGRDMLRLCDVWCMCIMDVCVCVCMYERACQF